MRFLAPFIVALLASAAIADSIELNVLPSSRAPFNAVQEWAQSLSRLRSVRVRAGGGRDRAQPDIKRSGTTLLVTGVIDASNRLVVPGKTFSVRQIGSLQTWLEEQRKSFGKARPPAADDRFGLTTADLKKVHAALKLPVTQSTKDQLVRKLVVSLARRVGLKLTVSDAAKKLVGNEKVSGEWQGFSCGTVMAAALRPRALVVVPRSVGGRVELHVTIEELVDEPWPVGWKPQVTKRKLVPKIYDPLPIDVQATPIANVMSALEARLELPIHYDTATLQLKGIDPSTATVSYQSDRTMYLNVIKFTLQKVKLKHEIRVDEVGKPFLWISPRGL